MKNILQFILIILLLSCCDYGITKLKIINKSESIIYLRLLKDTTIDENTYIYPLKIDESIMPPFTHSPNKEHGWQDMINQVCKDSALHIFVFKKPTVTKDVIKNKEYERFDFKVKDLETMNWTFTYRDTTENKKDTVLIESYFK